MNKKNAGKSAEKTKRIKIEYIIALVLVVLVAILFLSNGSFFSDLSASTSLETSTETYDKKLSEVLSKIENVGKVNAIITYKDNGKIEVLKNSETKVENGIKTTIESVVLVNGKPYVIKEYTPEIEGVLVVCEGAENIKVKMEITEVLTSIFNVSSDKIKILKMK